MLGWWIVIEARAPEVPDPKDNSATLASWETGLGGTTWLDDLCKQGKVTDLGGNGYPIRYSAFARDVTPWLNQGPPAYQGPNVIGEDYVLPGGRSWKVKIHRDRIAACPPDQVVTIEVWDLS